MQSAMTRWLYATLLTACSAVVLWRVVRALASRSEASGKQESKEEGSGNKAAAVLDQTRTDKADTRPTTSRSPLPSQQQQQQQQSTKQPHLAPSPALGDEASGSDSEEEEEEPCASPLPLSVTSLDQDVATSCKPTTAAALPPPPAAAAAAAGRGGGAPEAAASPAARAAAASGVDKDGLARSSTLPSLQALSESPGPLPRASSGSESAGIPQLSRLSAGTSSSCTAGPRSVPPAPPTSTAPPWAAAADGPESVPRRRLMHQPLGGGEQPQPLAPNSPTLRGSLRGHGSPRSPATGSWGPAMAVAAGSDARSSLQQLKQQWGSQPTGGSGHPGGGLIGAAGSGSGSRDGGGEAGVPAAAAVDAAPSGGPPAAEAELSLGAGGGESSRGGTAPLAALATVRSLVTSGPQAADAAGTPPRKGSAAGIQGAAGSRFETEQGPRLELEVLTGPAAGTAFFAGGGVTELVVGRSPGCSACIPDPEVSSRHAVLSWSAADKLWTLMDAGSLNGTALNGAAVGREGRLPGERVPLAHGDTLEFGSTTRCRLRCTPSRAPAQRHAAAAGGSPRPCAAATWHAGVSKPRHVGAGHDAGAVGGSLGSGVSPPGPRRISIGSNHSGGSMDGCDGRGGAAGWSAAELCFACCGVEAAVLQRVGVEHQRQGAGLEDVAAWKAPLHGHDQAGLFCIFDGHQGRGAAEEAATLLPDKLLTAFSTRGDSLSSYPSGGQRLLANSEACAAALEAAFLATDAELASDEGCTATAVLIEALVPPGGAAAGAAAGAGSQLQPCSGVGLRVANVGDSEAILIDLRSAQGSSSNGDDTKRGGPSGIAAAAAVAGAAAAAGPGGPSWQRLTEDHRIASNPEEAARLARRSGQAVSTRLCGLNLSRMLGDRFLKEAGLGFSAAPAVGPPLAVAPREDRVLVVASDGLWDVTSGDRAAQLVARAVAAADASVSGGGSGAAEGPSGGGGGGGGGAAAAAAAALVAHALQQRSKDDVSVMVLRIRPPAVAAAAAAGVADAE